MQNVCRKEVIAMRSDHGRHIDRGPHAVESDQDLENRVRVFLAGLKIPGLRGVTIDVDSGVATVAGAVNSFHEKQLATHCCQRVAGVVSVVNDIRVDSPSPWCEPKTEQRVAR